MTVAGWHACPGAFPELKRDIPAEQARASGAGNEELVDKFRKSINNKTDMDLASLPMGDFLMQAKASRPGKMPDTFKIFRYFKH
ncbi:hypothetical protein [Komagataeibacter swingsii]|uniref:hypothetical protein n=1 Tax=Komagataeibacter swingsii TaxID=215220 RepID=UPI0011B3B0D4|nr:hypothetical protein [Komagataeibacter swingsii]GBQ60729.1 hypothetical protein AA16373_1972 [Komagataeibacter swingsii DSM 16373]